MTGELFFLFKFGGGMTLFFGVTGRGKVGRGVPLGIEEVTETGGLNEGAPVANRTFLVPEVLLVLEVDGIIM
jgi:hypothetical protein